MNITDELREYAQSWRETPNLMDDLDAGDIDGLLGDFIAIADRIDAEHERKVAEVASGWVYWESTHVELPKDADGECIRIGDELRDDWNEQNQGEVEWLMLDRNGWWFRLNNSVERFYANEFHEWRHSHHHAPTVEDVLRDYASRILIAGCIDEEDELVAEYAAKLRLTDGKEQ